jgi:hypothetical protein
VGDLQACEDARTVCLFDTKRRTPVPAHDVIDAGENGAEYEIDDPEPCNRETRSRENGDVPTMAGTDVPGQMSYIKARVKARDAGVE